MKYEPNEKALEAAAKAMASRPVADGTGVIKKVPWRNLTAWANDAITAYMAELDKMGLAREANGFAGKEAWDASTRGYKADYPCIIIRTEPQT